MPHDRSTIDATIQLYFDGLYEGSVEKLSAAFHPTADLRWQESGALKIWTMPEWMEAVAKRESGRSKGLAREDFVVTVDRADEKTAFVKVRCQLPPRYFTDYLVLLHLSEGWRIVSKAFRAETRS